MQSGAHLLAPGPEDVKRAVCEGTHVVAGWDHGKT